MSSKNRTTAAKEEVKPALVPKLRFPEFRAAERWAEMPLKAAAQINPANSGLPESFIYIDLESVEAGKLKAKNRITREGAPSRAQRLVEPGDIIYQVVRPYQRNNLRCEFDDDEAYVASTGYAQLRAKGSNGFLYQSIHTDSFVGRVMAKCTGSNYPAINSSDLAEIQLPLPPSLAEQQKIAECLSSVDELIAAQARKVDALKTHKKGLTQQLFPREGETQPRLRFPEFQNAGAWDETKLGNHVGIQSGHSPSGFTLSSKGQYAFVKVEDLNNCVKYQMTGREFCNDSDGVVPSNSILFPKRGAAIELNKIRITATEILIDTNLMALTPKNGLTIEFLYYYLSNVGLSHIADTSTIPQINNKHIIPFDLLLPKEAEQQRIASCLSSLDDLITAETQKLGALKTHKKGLMQQLFPSPQEAEA